MYIYFIYKKFLILLVSNEFRMNRKQVDVVVNKGTDFTRKIR